MILNQINKMKPIEKALSQYGIRETVGKKHNQEVLKYFHLIGHEWVTTDETAWCSAFVNWACKMTVRKHSGALNARSWLTIGDHVCNPELGDIVVLWRDKPSSWKGHVGFFVRQTKSWIYVLGGNQSNKVCIKAYPKSRLLGYRRV